MISGMQEYGDRSLALDPRELLREAQQEAIDLHLWSFIAWRRIEQLRRALDDAFSGKTTRDIIL